MDTQSVLTRLLSACDRISRSWNLEEGLSALVHALYSLLRPQSVAVALADDRPGLFRIVAWRGLSAGFVNHHRFLATDPLMRRLLVAREMVSFPDFAPGDDQPAAALRLETPSGSLLAAPIEAMNRPVGMIIITDDKPEQFHEAEMLLIGIAARIAGACHDRCALYAERQHLSCVDQESGLWAFEFFCRRMSEEVARSRRAGKPVSLMLIDIDGYMAFSETHGPQATDELFTRFADLVRRTMRGIDFAGRFALDDILVALPETSLSGAHKAAERILTTLREQPVGHGGQVMTASIGVSQLSLTEDDGIGPMLERAQKALYLAQFHGKNRVEAAES
jgi:diguanylate cyclase (GGDEF)-like protein